MISKTSQRHAVDSRRKRLTEHGMIRFEIIGRDTDRELVRTIAHRLAEDGADAESLLAAVHRTISGEPPKKGSILKALLASPLGGSELDLTRPREEGRTPNSGHWSHAADIIEGESDWSSKCCSGQVLHFTENNGLLKSRTATVLTTRQSFIHKGNDSPCPKLLRRIY